MADAGTSRQRADAPAPDDPRKADTPTEMSSTSWTYALRKTAHEFTSDQCTDLAATLTYFAVLSIFPALIALVSLLGVVGQGQASVDALLSIVQSVAPGSTVDLIRGPLEEFSSSPAAGVGLVVGILVAIWSASGYVGAFSRAMNRIYEIDEGRSFFALRTMQLAVTVATILLLLVMVLISVVSGPVTDAVGSALGLGETVQVVWSVAKWPVLAAAVVLLIAMLYYATPNARQPKFRWMSLGALVALLVLVLASVVFGLYVTNFSNYDRTYGSLAGIIVFLLWLWIMNLALLFGAEFDAELERARQLQAGIAAEENIQLPPRGTKKSEKAAATERADVQRGRGIRRRASNDDS